MASTLCWSRKPYFFPLNVSTPTCLTEYIPPEQDAHVLTLDCRDARSVLYTIHIDGERHYIEDRNLDFTCCDSQGAVLARNVILWTLVVDNDVKDVSSELWNIFFHFLLDDSSLALLLSQSEKLAKLSTSITTWNASPYASAIRFCTLETLAELHCFWTKYSETRHWTEGRRAAFKDEFVGSMRQTGEKLPLDFNSCMRNAGPYALAAAKTISNAYDAFWKTGVLYSDESLVSQSSNVNPTFAFAAYDAGFLAHPSTFPLSGFHQGAAYIHLDYEKTKEEPVSSDAVYEVAREQFRTWCQSFRLSLTKAKNIKLRILLGDALAICRTLGHFNSTGELTALVPTIPWRATPLVLDGGEYQDVSDGLVAPTEFDVIDTSDLADRSGLLNVLVVCQPLLVRSAVASIRTETVLSLNQNPVREFQDSICGDVATMAIMMDLVPVAHLSGFSTRSNAHEIVSAQVFGVKDARYHEHVVWKIPSQLSPNHRFPGSVAVSTSEMPRFLYRVYLKMFLAEYLKPLVRENADHLSTSDLQRLYEKTSNIRYCRKSFALFLKYLMNRIECDWDEVMSKLNSLIRWDKELLVGLAYQQDFIANSFMLDIRINEGYSPHYADYLEDPQTGRFTDWQTIPEAVCIVLSVPMDKFRLLDDADESTSDPYLEINVCHTDTEYSSLFTPALAAFGTITSHGAGENTVLRVHEDPLGRKGCSPALFAVWVPTWTLAENPDKMAIALWWKMTNRQAYGKDYEIHSVSLMDLDAVHISRFSPTVDDTLPRFTSVKNQDTCQEVVTTSVQAHFDHATRELDQLTFRHLLPDDLRRNLPKAHNLVDVEAIRECQVACRVGSSQVPSIFVSPYPVQDSQLKVRVERNGSQVEVVAPIHRRLSWNPYPIRRLTSWNMHRVNLNRLPVLDPARLGSFGWLSGHSHFVFSHDDRAHVLAGKPQELDDFVSIHKFRLVAVMSSLIDHETTETDKPIGFRLQQEGLDASIYVLIDTLRLDSGSHTFVADSYVLPVDDRVPQHVREHLAKLSVITIPCSKTEYTAWTIIIPSYVERCRDWKHTSRCEYVAQVPVSTEPGKSPICRCGRGRVSHRFFQQQDWLPFAPYVTRMAVSYLFAVSYLDPVTEEHAKMESSPDPEPQGTDEQCHNCQYCERKILERPMRCSRCQQAIYCDKLCQIANWKTHKTECMK